MSVTTIEWTKRPGTVGETWNLVTGCNKVDRGCKHCYAEIMHKRLRAMGQDKYRQEFLAGPVCHEDLLELPFTWKKPRTVFVNSMSDLFHEKVGKAFLTDVFDVMKDTPQHTYLILTKRPEEAKVFWNWRKLRGDLWTCPPNVWLGTSVNDQASADIRIPKLLDIEEVLHFVSYEPATGAVDFRLIGTNESWSLDALAGEGFADGRIYHQAKLDWVIMGGESGPKADPMHPAWARKVRDACQATGTPFFFKQWGTWVPVVYPSQIFQHEVTYKFDKKHRVLMDPEPCNLIRVGKHAGGHDLDGQTWQQYPQPKTTTT